MVEYCALDTLSEQSNVNKIEPFNMKIGSKMTPVQRMYPSKSMKSTKKKCSLKGQRAQWIIEMFARISVPIVIVAFNIYYWDLAYSNGPLEV